MRDHILQLLLDDQHNSIIYVNILYIIISNLQTVLQVN